MDKKTIIIGIIIMSGILLINLVSASPNLTVSSPTNITYTEPEINLIISTEGVIDSYWYNLNNNKTNISFTPNITIGELKWENYHTLYVFVNNTSGDITQDIRRFYVGSLDKNYFVFYLLALALGGLLLVLSYVKSDPILMIFAGFLFSAFAISFSFNGYPPIESQFFDIVMITISSGFSFYIMTKGSLQLVEEGI